MCIHMKMRSVMRLTLKRILSRNVCENIEVGGEQSAGPYTMNSELPIATLWVISCFHR